MNLHLHYSEVHPKAAIAISGSKSETNRLLLLQALHPNITLEKTSNSDDSEVMRKALAVDSYKEDSTNVSTIDIHHAGTAMRFLTAYFAIQEGKEVVLTGSHRMKERPIAILVDALRQLGADISYEGNHGFPPLRIKGKKIAKNQVTLQANVSSQYISALLLIASKLDNGLEIILEGELTSVPYINMTLALLNEIGVSTDFQNNKITIRQIVDPTDNSQSTTHNRQLKTITVESDWSSASYYYSIIALSKVGTEIILSSFKKNSLQGDSALIAIYRNFGVETFFDKNSICLRKTYNPAPTTHNLQLTNSPDIAQTLAVTCFGLGVACHLTGLHTLKIKETDRLQALQTELTKLGANVKITEESLTLEAADFIQSSVRIDTYNDHRMAMAFAPLALKTDLVIEDSEVVSKSYPHFWNDLKSIGFHISESRH